MQDPERVFNLLDLKAGTTFMDGGCGAGDYAMVAAAQVGESGRVIALDSAEHSIRQLNDRARQAELANLSAHVCDITCPLPWDTGSVDVVLLSTVLHIRAVRDAAGSMFSEFKRLLRPGGMLAILECRKVEASFGPPMHARLSEKEVAALAAPCGFSLRSATSFEHTYLACFAVGVDRRSTKLSMKDNIRIHELISTPDFYFGVKYALEKGLFELDEQGESINEIAKRIDLSPHQTQALLLAGMHLGALKQKDSKFALTKVGIQYFQKSSPHYMGSIIEMMPTDYEMFKAGFEGNYREIFTPEATQLMVAMMHHKSAGLAAHWPTQVELPEHATFLDVGAGSAVHAIEACRHFKSLHAIALDLPPVCKIAESFIEQYGASDRVRTYPCDMFKESWGTADIIFMSDILHDWPEDRAMLLLRKAHETLPETGRLILLEVLLDDCCATPFVAVAFNLAVMKMLPEAGQRTAARIDEMLEEAGFNGKTERMPTLSGATIIQAFKA